MSPNRRLWAYPTRLGVVALLWGAALGVWLTTFAGRFTGSAIPILIALGAICVLPSGRWHRHVTVALLVVAVICAALLWDHTDAISVMASAEVGNYATGTVVAGIKWASGDTDLRLTVFNNNDREARNVELVVSTVPLAIIADIAQVTDARDVTFEPVSLATMTHMSIRIGNDPPIPLSPQNRSSQERIRIARLSLGSPVIVVIVPKTFTTRGTAVPGIKYSSLLVKGTYEMEGRRYTVESLRPIQWRR